MANWLLDTFHLGRSSSPPAAAVPPEAAFTTKPDWPGKVHFVEHDFKGELTPFPVKDLPVRDFKARSDLAQLPPGKDTFLGTALEQSLAGGPWAVSAVFGKPGVSFDADGKLQSFLGTWTSQGIHYLLTQTDHPNPGLKDAKPDLQKAQLAITQREALMTRGRQLAGPGK